MEMPQINFEPLLNYSEDEFREKVWSNPLASCFLVYLRCKYSKETKWRYYIECCGLYGFDDLIWFNDWREGEEDVEYLGVAVIDIPSNKVLEV